MNQQHIKILIVEDEKPVAETIRIQLEQLGYAVAGITDNAEQDRLFRWLPNCSPIWC